MLTRLVHRNLTWIDLERPTKDEVDAVLREFHVHPMLADELVLPSIRPKAEVHGNSMYLIMHFPSRTDDHERLIEKEIDFVIGKDFIITAHYENFDPIYEFQKMFRVSSILAKHHIGDHAGYLFCSMIKTIYRDLELRLEDINNDLKKIERKIFENKESLMVREISETHRRILDIKQTIRFHEETLRTFSAASKQFFGGNYGYEMESVASEYYKVSNTLDGHKEILKDLKETNDSLLTTKTNQVMKVLTFITFTALPFSLTTGILGMNAAFTEHVTTGTILIIFALVSLVGICVYLYFRKRTWI